MGGCVLNSPWLSMTPRLKFHKYVFKYDIFYIFNLRQIHIWFDLIWFETSMLSKKPNLNWPSMQRCHYPIYNGTIESFFWSGMNYIYMIFSLNCLFSFAGSLRKWLAHFLFISVSVRKKTVSSTFLIRLRFQGLRCKSDIASFAEGHLKLRLQSL